MNDFKAPALPLLLTRGCNGRSTAEPPALWMVGPAPAGRSGEQVLVIPSAYAGDNR